MVKLFNIKLNVSYLMAPKSNFAAVLILLMLMALHFTGPLCLPHLSEPVGLGPLYKIQLNLHEVL